MLGEDVYPDVDKDQNFVDIEIWKASKNAIQHISRHRRRSKNRPAKIRLNPASNPTPSWKTTQSLTHYLHPWVKPDFQHVNGLVFADDYFFVPLQEPAHFC